MTNGTLSLIGTALTVLTGGALVGQCPNQRFVQPANYQQQVAVVPAAVVLVPSYFAQFNPAATQQTEEQAGSPQAPAAPMKLAEPPPQPAVTTTDQKLDKVIDLLTKLLAEIDAAKGDAAPAGTAPAFDAAAAQRVGTILAHSCINCHSAAVAKTKGGDLTLIESVQGVPTLTNLNRASRKEIVNRLTARTMPPVKAAAAAITDAERQTLTDWFNK